jgi:hypothetical protein
MGKTPSYFHNVLAYGYFGQKSQGWQGKYQGE